MAIEALLLCHHPEATRVLRRVLDDLNIVVTQADTPESAVTHAMQHKFDAVLVDCDDVNGAPDFIRTLRRGTSNRSAILFAITNGKTDVRTAFDLGANFVLEKPISLDRASRSLRAAHGLMVRERRRYLRQPIETNAFVLLPDGTDLKCTALNLSEGGLAVQSPHPLPQGAQVRLTFSVPGGRKPAETRAEVCWAGPQGRAGLRFLYMADDSRQELVRWLNQEIERSDPATLIVNANRPWTKVGR